MKMKYHSIAKVTLILVYLVIIAGAVVRMTGSGMGCPDWPKCFGYYIPPTEIAEIQWQPNRTFEKGQVIIMNESLMVAREDHTTGTAYDETNWAAYTKHDYAIFNATHTWIEYINRLLGALAGLGTLLLALASVTYWKSNKKITIISWIALLGMLFQGWLGATVVYSVLQPVKITMHMVMALLIVALLIFLLQKTHARQKEVTSDKKTNLLLWVALGLTMIQIIIGTQVRQFIDDQISLLGEQAKELWLLEPQLQFYIHRSFSILVVLLNLFIAYTIYKKTRQLNKMNWVLALIGVEVLTGIGMYYFDFPFGSQPLHLVIASLLFGVQFYLVLETQKTKIRLESS
jgi:cytochrome c oxidase assembly protein subunit 15